MTIHFYLERKQLKSSEKSIYCYIRGFQNRKSIILNTGQKINPIYWNKDNERAIGKGKGKYLGAFELNNFLDSYTEEIKRTTRTFLADNPNTDFEPVKNTILEKFGKSKKSQYTFLEALDFFIETRKRELSPNSLRKFTTLKHHLIEFESIDRRPLTFGKMDLLFYDRFLSYLIEKKKMVNNSAFKIIGLLKIFLNWAYDRGINKYQDFKKFKVKEDKVDIVTLSSEELERVRELDLRENVRLDRVRDLFVFGCYTGGRFSDLSRIEWRDIKDDCWYLRVHKTRDIIEIPLMKESLFILGKYKDSPTPLPRISNQKLNAYIKEVCTIAKIDDPVRIVRYRGNSPVIIEEPKFNLISSHTARRTFITQSLLRGVKAEVVMSISGHKSFRTFKKYLDITRKDKEVELKKAWNKQSIYHVNFD